jgi:hypothetical protein
MVEIQTNTIQGKLDDGQRRDRNQLYTLNILHLEATTIKRKVFILTKTRNWNESIISSILSRKNLILLWKMSLELNDPLEII